MTKIFTYILLFISTFSFSQANKTIKDTSFKKGDIIKVSDIYFALDDRGHRNDSSYKIIADFLSSHKNLIVEIGSHTDTRGKATNNYTLSCVRAKYMRDELISRFNIDSNQVKFKGYGITKVIKSDLEISKAKTKQEKEELHQINRRMELKVLFVK